MLSGAVTTVGAAAVLLGCVITFFATFGSFQGGDVDGGAAARAE